MCETDHFYNIIIQNMSMTSRSTSVRCQRLGIILAPQAASNVVFSTFYPTIFEGRERYWDEVKLQKKEMRLQVISVFLIVGIKRNQNK